MGFFRRWRRRRWLVDKRQQVPFASVLVTQTTLTVAMLGLFAYLVDAKMKAVTLSAVGQDGLISQQLFKTSMGFLARVILVIGLTAFVQIVFGILMSHKLAGPVLKMKSVLADVAAGRPVQGVVFRSGDYLDELADLLNTLLERVERRRSRLLETIPELDKALDGLRGQAANGGSPSQAKGIGALVEPATALLKEYQPSRPPNVEDPA